MTSFDAAWLAQYQTKMATFRGAPLPDLLPPPDLIEFTIPHATMLLNPLLRLHWVKRRAYQKGIAAEIAAMTQQYRAHESMLQAHVRVTRYSLRLADPDGLPSCAKCILDSIVVRSARNPDGIGLIRNDDPSHLVLDVSQQTVANRIEMRTHVLIERLA